MLMSQVVPAKRPGAARFWAPPRLASQRQPAGDNADGNEGDAQLPLHETKVTARPNQLRLSSKLAAQPRHLLKTAHASHEASSAAAPTSEASATSCGIPASVDELKAGTPFTGSCTATEATLVTATPAVPQAATCLPANLHTLLAFQRPRAAAAKTPAATAQTSNEQAPLTTGKPIAPPAKRQKVDGACTVSPLITATVLKAHVDAAPPTSTHAVKVPSAQPLIRPLHTVSAHTQRPMATAPVAKLRLAVSKVQATSSAPPSSTASAAASGTAVVLAAAKPHLPSLVKLQQPAGSVLHARSKPVNTLRSKLDAGTPLGGLPPPLKKLCVRSVAGATSGSGGFARGLAPADANGACPGMAAIIPGGTSQPPIDGDHGQQVQDESAHVTLLPRPRCSSAADAGEAPSTDAAAAIAGAAVAGAAASLSCSPCASPCAQEPLKWGTSSGTLDCETMQQAAPCPIPDGCAAQKCAVLSISVAKALCNAPANKYAHADQEVSIAAWDDSNMLLSSHRVPTDPTTAIMGEGVHLPNAAAAPEQPGLHTAVPMNSRVAACQKDMFLTQPHTGPSACAHQAVKHSAAGGFLQSKAAANSQAPVCAAAPIASAQPVMDTTRPSMYVKRLHVPKLIAMPQCRGGALHDFLPPACIIAERLQPCHPSLQQQVAAGINAAKPAVRCARAIAVQRIQRLIRPTANSIRPSRQQCAEGAMAAADEPGSTACVGTPLDSSWKQFYAKACGMQSGVSMAQLHQGMQLLTSTKGQYTQDMQPSPGLHVMQWWMRTAASPTHLSATDVALAAPIIADAGQLERQRHRKQAVLNIPPPCTPLQGAAIDGTDRAEAKANACVRLTSSSAQLQLQMLADDRSPAFGTRNPLTHGLLGNGPAMQSDPSPSHAHDASPDASSPAGSQTMVREWPAQLKRVHGKSVASHIGISSQQASMCTSAEHVAAGSKLPIVSVSSQDQHVLYDGTAAGACKEAQLAVDLGHASVGDGFDVDVWLPGVSMQLMGALFN